MKHLPAFLILLIGLTAPAATNTDVVINLRDARLSVADFANRNLTIQPRGLPDTASPSIVLGERILARTDTNGICTLTNLQPYGYGVTVERPPTELFFAFAVTATNLGTIYAADNLAVFTDSVYPPGGTAWAISASDIRYAPFGAVGGSNVIANLNGSGTNTTLYNPTNNGAITITRDEGPSIFLHQTGNMEAPEANASISLVSGGSTPWLLLYPNTLAAGNLIVQSNLYVTNGAIVAGSKLAPKARMEADTGNVIASN